MSNDQETKKYQLTRTGDLVVRCLTEPFDTSLRSEIERLVYAMANENPRPIILEEQMPRLVELLTETMLSLKVISRDFNISKG